MRWNGTKLRRRDTTVFDYNFAPIKDKSKKRVANNKEFKLVDESAKWVKSQQDDNTFPLQYDEYLAKSKKLDEQSKKFNGLKDYKNGLTFKSLPHDEALIKNDTVLQNKRKRWFKSLNNDVYVDEAVNVLKDLKAAK